MVLNKKGGNFFLVNLLSDFILNYIPKEESSIINVVDFNNFIVVKGKTSSSEVLDLSKIVNDFIEKHKMIIPNQKSINTIDLVEYECEMDKFSDLNLTFYNSPNPSYHIKQIENYLESGSTSYFDFTLKTINEDLLSYSSSFPFGYSLSNGRLLYYYFKKVSHNLKSNIPDLGITFEIKNYKSDINCFNIINNSTNTIDDELKSYILENLKFDMSELETDIKKIDWSFELTSPELDYDCLKIK